MRSGRWRRIASAARVEALPLFAVGDQTALDGQAQRLCRGALGGRRGRRPRRAGGAASSAPPTGRCCMWPARCWRATLPGGWPPRGFEVERAVLYRAHARPRLAEARRTRCATAAPTACSSIRGAARRRSRRRLRRGRPGAACRKHRLLLPVRSDRRAASRRRAGPVLVAERPDQISLFALVERTQARVQRRGLTRALASDGRPAI